MEVAIIPTDIDSLAAPVRALSEAQKNYLILEAYKNNLINQYNDTQIMNKDIFRVLKEQREHLKFIKEMTVDTQMEFEQQAADFLIAVMRQDPQLREKIGEELARKFQKKAIIQDIEINVN